MVRDQREKVFARIGKTEGPPGGSFRSQRSPIIVTPGGTTRALLVIVTAKAAQSNAAGRCGGVDYVTPLPMRRIVLGILITESELMVGGGALVQ